MTAVIAAIFQVEGTSTSPLGESCAFLRFLDPKLCDYTSKQSLPIYLLQKATDYLIKNYSFFQLVITKQKQKFLLCGANPEERFVVASDILRSLVLVICHNWVWNFGPGTFRQLSVQVLHIAREQLM
jgi:hypothetical protein